MAQMPRPRLADDPAEYMEQAARWTAWVEQKAAAAGDRTLPDLVHKLAGEEMEAHLDKHLRGSVVCSAAAEQMMAAADASAEELTNAHLRQYWDSPSDRSVVALDPSAEKCVVVRWAPNEAQASIWALGEAADDPDPATVKEWVRSQGAQT